ncbi:MAG: hypothetical protein GY822_28365 [Deltaproteobacteria bacterium]|nr:hypothetical protein [Deltaproteobacteria bacterium]
MANVVVTQAHSLSASDAKEKFADFETMMGKYGVKAKWSGNNAALKGVGVSGSIAILDATVKVELKLGMMAKAAGVDAKRLEESITKRLAKAFDG